MKERTKVKLIIATVLSLILIIIVASTSSLKKGGIIVKGIEEIMSMTEPQLIYLEKTDCEYSKEFKPVLNMLRTEYGFTYNYINVDDLNDRQLADITKRLEIKGTLKTPYMVVVENGEVLRSLQGLQDEKTVFLYLQRNGVLSPSLIFQDDQERFPNIKFINMESYEKLQQSTDTQILVIGKKTCPACLMAKESLNKLSFTYNLKVNYIEIDEFTVDERTDLFASIKYFDGKTRWGTPVMFVFENGESKNVFEGFKTDESYIDFFRTNNVISGES